MKLSELLASRPDLDKEMGADYDGFIINYVDGVYIFRVAITTDDGVEQELHIKSTDHTDAEMVKDMLMTGAVIAAGAE